MGNDRTVRRVRDASERELQRRLDLAEEARAKMGRWSEVASAEQTAKRLGRKSDARALARARRDLERDPQLKRMLKASRRELRDQLRRRERGS